MVTLNIEKSVILLVSLFSFANSEAACGIRNTVKNIFGFDKNSKSDNYIVGGTTALRNEFPWQVSLQFFHSPSRLEAKKWDHFCGGSIINDQWVVTAGHCILDIFTTQNLRIVAGAHYNLKTEKTTQIYAPEKIFVHPRYDGQSAQNDIALIKLSKKISVDKKSVYPICLPKDNEVIVPTGGRCVASGWGKIYPDGPSSEVLLKVDLPTVPKNICASRYRNVRHTVIDDSKICAGPLNVHGKGVCQGDSGGPLACLKDGVYKLAGVTSFGVICGSGDYPSVFTRIATYRRWMDSIIGRYS